MSLISETSLPLVVHTGKTPEEHPLEAITLAKAYPDSVFILAHMARLHGESLNLIREIDNIYVDTSPLTRLMKKQEKYLFQAPFFKKPINIFEYLAERIGIEKVIWGSDYPFSIYSEEMAFLDSLNENDFEQLSKNAEIVFGNGKL